MFTDAILTQTHPNQKLRVAGKRSPGRRHIGRTPSTTDTFVVNEEQRKFIARQSTHKRRTRALLELLPRRGPKAFHVFCYALLVRNKNELVSVLTDPEKEDVAVCFPDYSSFHMGGEVYLRAEREEITLKQGAIEMCFPLIRWTQLECVLDDIAEAVYCLSHNRCASLKRRIGGNVCVSVESPALPLTYVTTGYPP
jgi:hypothetical protein